MKIRHVSLLIGLTLLSVFALAAAWEFALKELLFPLAAADFEKAAHTGRWQIVIMATIVAALALLVPGLWLRHSIAARQRAEQVADTSASQLRLIIDAVPALIAHVDKDRRYRFGNKQYQDWFGLSCDQIVGRHIREITGEPAYRLIEESVGRVLSGKASTRVDEMPYKHGGSRIVQRSYVPHLSRDGTVEGYFSVVVDISERQRVEQALKESEARATYAEKRLAEAMENLSDGIAIYDSEDRLILFNERYRNLYPGVSDLIAPGLKYQDLIQAGYERGEWGHPSVELSPHFAQRLAGDNVRVPFEFQLQDGRWIETRDYPMEGGGVFQYRIDITDRKHAEQALQHSEASLAKAQRIAQLGSWDWDILSDTNAWSDEHCRIFGMEKGSFSGTYDAFLSLVHPEDRDSVRVAVRETLEKRVPFDIEYRIVHPDGAVRLIHGQGKAEFAESGRPIRMNGTGQDITERKHTEQALRDSEHLYRELVELAPDLIWIHCDGTITYINPAGARLLGAESPYAIIGKSARDFIHPDCWDVVRSRMKRVTVDRLPQPPMEMKFVRLDGEVIEVESFGTPFTHEGRAAVRGVVRDITERKRAQELLSEPKGRRKELQEELIESGENPFSDTDMLELVLSLAQPRGNMRPLANRLIERYGSFAEVINADTERLPEVRGVGEPVVAALKIVHGAAARLVRSRILNRPIVGSSQQLLDYVRANMSLNGKEELRILFLDRKNTVIADEAHQQGTIDHVSLYPREIVKRALQLNASALIIAHNHPSGDPTPSNSDVDMTRKLVEATRQLDIEVHDHIIVGKGAHVSLRNTGLI